MYFSARGAEASATVTDGMLREPPVHWSIGVASADASLVFHPSPFDPLLTRVEGVGDTRDAREPSAVALGDRWLLVVRGETLAGADEGLFSAGP